MAVIAQILNGTNLNRDAGFSSLVSSFLRAGVRGGFGSDLAITTNQCGAGMAYIEVTRTNVTPNEVFLLPVWVDTATAVDTSGDGYIVILLDQTKINDGSANSGDGTGIATVEKVASLPSSNYIELASLASGVITDTRLISGTKKVLLDNAEHLQALNSSGDIVEVLELLTSGNIPQFKVHPRTYAGRSIADNQDLIDLEYLNANLPSGGTISYELSETLTAEDLVSIINDAGTAKTRKLLPDENATAQQMTTDPSGSWGDAIEVDTNKVVYAYERSNVIYAVCMTISGTVLTIGAKKTIASSTASNHPNMAKLDTDKFIIGYRQYDGTQRCKGTICTTISTTTITTGTAFNIKTPHSASPKLLQMGTNKFVAVYGSGNSSTWSGVIYGRVATVSGTTPSFGTEQTLIASVTDISIKDSAVRVANDIFYVFSNSDVLYCTISGTVITTNARATIATVITGVPYVGITASSFLIYETGYIHAYSHDGAGNETFLCTTEIDFTIAQILGLETDGKYLLANNQNDNGYLKAWIEDNEVKYSRKFSPTDANIGSFQRVCQYGETTIDQIFYGMSNVYGLIGAINNFEDFAGILQASGTAGQSRAIAVKGSQSEGHSFADADVNKSVYIQDDASLDVAMSKFPIGKVYENAVMVIKN